MSLAQRVTELERRDAQHDKQIKAIRDLVQEGMRLLIETRKEGRATRKELRAIATNVRDLTDSLRRGSNGHNKRKLDLQ